MKALFRFLISLFFLGIAFFFVWYSLLTYGKNRAISDYQTDLVQTLKKKPRPLLWTPLNTTQPYPQYAWIDAKFIGDQWKVGSNDADDTLAEQLRNPTFSYLLLNIYLESSQALPQLRELLKKDDLWKRTVLCSAADGILRDLRELEPEWTFCNGEIFMARALGFASIGLESLARIDADIFFVHVQNLNLNKSHHAIIAEAKRQNKLVFIGPVTGPLESYDADGWVIKNPVND